MQFILCRTKACIGRVSYVVHFVPYHVVSVFFLSCSNTLIFSCHSFFTFYAFFHCSACSSSAVFSECCHQSPVQSAVVLKNPKSQSSRSPGITVTIICQDDSAKDPSTTRSCGNVIKPCKTKSAFPFSKSLNDVDRNVVDSAGTCDFVERTSSEGKLLSVEDHFSKNKFQFLEKGTNIPSPVGLNSSNAICAPSLPSNPLHIPSLDTSHGSVCIPLMDDKADTDSSKSKTLLHYLFSFSPSSSANSLHMFQEHDAYSRSLHAGTSSSMLLGSTDFCSDDMGDDDVFEDNVPVKEDPHESRAPLCSIEDSDLECPSPFKKLPPASPVSASGDLCRSVYRGAILYFFIQGAVPNKVQLIHWH